MGLGDAFHSLFVLVAVGSYALPLYEALQRRSTFYTAVFGAVLLLSASLHCEEAGVCAPFAPSTHARLSTLSGGMSLYLGCLMLLVVLEIRGEVLGRAVMAVWAVAATLRDAHDNPTNAAVATALGVAVLAFDTLTWRRKFTGAWWKRLGLIAVMAALGGGLFKLVHATGLYEWHGIWHLYLSGAVYLLLLAQRTKRQLAAAASRGVGAGVGGVGAKGARLGGGGAAASHAVSSYGSNPLTTPTKRRSGAGASAGVLGGEDDGVDGRQLGGAPEDRLDA